METREKLRELEEKVTLGLEKAYEKMVKFKKQKNSPLVISKNGKIVRIPAEKIHPTTKAINPYTTKPSLNQNTDHN
jgi:imidazolonepropionase-like amidohydrolase